MPYDATYYERFMPLAEERVAERDRLTQKGLKRDRKALQRRSRQAQMVFVGLGIALLVLLAFVAAARWLRRKRVREARRDEVLRACAMEPPGETIFVCIAAYRGVDGAHAIRSLFARARCPSRVYVGVVHHADGELGDPDLLDTYATLAANWNDPLILVDHVRVERVNLRDSDGAYASRMLAYSKFFRDERYVLQLRADAVLSQDWDRILIDELKSTQDPRAVLSTMPPSYLPQERHARETQDPAPASFLYVSSVDAHGIPSFAPRVATGRPTRPMRSVGWSPVFSFARGEWVRALPPVRGKFLPKAAEALRVYGSTWVAGWTVYAPCRVPVFVAPQHSIREKPVADVEYGESRRHDAASAAATFVQSMKQQLQVNVLPENGRSFPSFWRQIGINIANGSASSAARLGLSSESSTDEILDKFGSMQEYTASLEAVGGNLAV